MYVKVITPYGIVIFHLCDFYKVEVLQFGIKAIGSKDNENLIPARTRVKGIVPEL